MQLADRLKSLPTETGRLSVTPVSPALGAEISGVDVSKPLPAASIQAIRDALATYGVVFFRDQQLTPQQHVDFARSFCSDQRQPVLRGGAGYPMIAEVRKEPEQKGTSAATGTPTTATTSNLPWARCWSRASCRAPAATRCSPACMRPMTRCRTGSSGRSPACAPASSRHVSARRQDPRRSASCRRAIGNPELATQDAMHPVVIRHPESGRKALFVNPGFTLRFEGWTEEESPAAARLSSSVTPCGRNSPAASIGGPARWRFWDNRCDLALRR